MMEEWVARRINSAHVLKPCPQSRKRNYLYVVTEFIDGQTLTQWMIDNPKPDLETVRGIVEQIAKGLQAFHRMEMLHQDLRPDNIMIDKTGTVKIIDFGSTQVKGVVEAAPSTDRDDILGTAQYTAPEYFLGESGIVALRHLLARRHHLSDADRTAALRRRGRARRERSRSSASCATTPRSTTTARFRPGSTRCCKKAVHPDPYKRYEELSEFVYRPAPSRARAFSTPRRRR